MMTYENWNIEAMTGYKPITTFYQDFSIAESFGKEAIIDTYKDALSLFDNYKIATEVVMVLNWKCWRWTEDNTQLSQLYLDLYEQAEDEFFKRYEGNEEATHYYFRTTD